MGGECVKCSPEPGDESAVDVLVVIVMLSALVTLCPTCASDTLSPTYCAL